MACRGWHTPQIGAAVPDTHHPGQRKPLTIIGLGNELLSDDGTGIRVVRELRTRLPAGTATFEELSVGGLELLEYITGYDRCIIVDAIVSGEHPAGTVYRCVPAPEHESGPLTSSHQIDLMQVVHLAELLGADTPRSLVVYGIEAGDISTFHDGCTRTVAQAIPKLVDTICSDLRDHPAAFGAPDGEWKILCDAPSD